jgi:type IV secretory pathway TrbL component
MCGLLVQPTRSLRSAAAIQTQHNGQAGQDGGTAAVESPQGAGRQRAHGVMAAGSVMPMAAISISAVTRASVRYWLIRLAWGWMNCSRSAEKISSPLGFDKASSKLRRKAAQP